MKKFNGIIKFKNEHSFPDQFGGKITYKVFADLEYAVDTSSTRDVYNINTIPFNNDKDGLNNGKRYTPHNWLKDLFNKGEIEIITKYATI